MSARLNLNDHDEDPDARVRGEDYAVEIKTKKKSSYYDAAWEQLHGR